jgi:hypothetical protein
MRIAVTILLALSICALALKIVLSEYDLGRERLVDSIVIALGMGALFMIVMQ